MNDEPNTPLETVGDGPLEARIVAAVLGEASAFEAAEIERICRERPELLVLQKRIQELHGLLQESAKTAADEAWKLPPEKRSRIAALSAAPVRLTPTRPRWVRNSAIALMAVAACAALVIGVLQFRPGRYEAVATLEIKPHAPGATPLGSTMAEEAQGGLPSAQFFGTEFEKIKSRNTLEKVAGNLDLAARWDMDPEDAVKALKDSIKTEQIRGTDLINIRVRHPNPQDADDIAREVAYAYKEYRDQLVNADQERALAELRKAVRDQEDKVEERRKVLATIARTKAVESEQGLAANETRESAIRRGLDAQDYADAKRDFETDQQLLQTMKLKLIGETISERIPADSVVVHEVPGGGAKSAERKSEALASVDADRRMKPLTTTLPAELIEGTPMPIEVPNLETPVDGPAGSATWGLAQHAPRESGEAKPAATRSKPASPTPPTAAAAAAIAAASTPGSQVPVPDTEAVTPSADFGDDASFATGWSEGSDTAVTNGIRTGDAPVERSAIDGVLDSSAPAKPSGPATLGDLPALGALFLEGQSGTAVERARRLRETGRYDDARGVLENTLAENPGDAEAKDALAKMEDPIRTNPARTHELPHDYWDTSKTLANGKESRAEHEILSGYKSEFLFRGADLADVGQEGDRRIPIDWVTGGANLADVDGDGLKIPVPAEETDFEGFMEYGSPIAEANERLKADVARLRKQLEEPVISDSNKQAVFREYQEKIQLLAGDKDALAKAIREQEDKVEERRKVLSTIVRTKGIIYEGDETLKDETREEAIKRGLDAQDYLDAKREFERDQELLQQMKLRLMETSLKSKAEPSKPALIELMEDISASEEPYSTFSLNISDASFRIAQAALAKGERPDPAGIKVEQFYNAMDYGDPSPAPGEPVSANIEQSAHPLIPGRNLVRIAMKTAAAGRTAAQPLRLTLLVDQSGSMSRADRREAMDAAMTGLDKLLTEKDLVNVVGFSRTPRLLADGTPGDQAGKNLAALVNQSASEGGTNLELAIDLAGQLAARRMLAGAQNRIVLLTDGAANLGDADPARLAEKVGQLRQRGIAFDIAGIAADGLNDELLAELARHGNGRYHIVGKGGDDDFARQLAGAFRPAAENVKVQVRFNPERVARYKLMGFEKDRLRTEDFRNDAVDAAELAAEEAGVAIYQVEPIPGGSGETGEVSVRFRDAASGAMVERAWTIAHDPATPAFDRATPSMQLAGLAMLAGEKLKGGPLGDIIRFDDLAGIRAEVKRHYGDSPRVNELLGMIGNLR